jgi:hypothetical protein
LAEADRLHESALSPWVSGMGPIAIMALGLLLLLLVCVVLGALAIFLVVRIRRSGNETSPETSHST